MHKYDSKYHKSTLLLDFCIEKLGLILWWWSCHMIEDKWKTMTETHWDSWMCHYVMNTFWNIKKHLLWHIPILVDDHKDIGNEHDGVESQDVGYQEGNT